jgi:hypothetical protein
MGRGGPNNVWGVKTTGRGKNDVLGVEMTCWG